MSNHALEERRTHITVELHGSRLGMYLEPVEESSRDACVGACVKRFDPIDGGLPGEAEASGVVRLGFRITAINDVDTTWMDFNELVGMLVRAPRPVRVTFRDPDVCEWRDRYGFIRNKLHVERENQYIAASAAATDKNNRDWSAFLQELGGVKGPAFGVLRLMRDACGELMFPIEPAVRLNALSPLHGRMHGISSSAAAGSTATRPPAGAAAVRSKSAGALVPSSSAGAATVPAHRAASHMTTSRAAATEHATPTADVTAGERSGSDAETAEKEAAPPHAVVVVSIFKRCWSPGTIGVSQPPGLSVALPGEIPPFKIRERIYNQLRRLVVYGGIPAAFRRSVWYELPGARAKAALHMPGYYASLVAASPSSEAAIAIQKDLDRTFPGHPFFERREGIASLQRLLTAFAVHNSDVGYCQSINFLAGFLLLLLPEEHAFWVLDVLVNEILPPNYYNSTLMGVHIDQRVLAHLVDELMPDASEALQRAGVQLHLVVVEWFMCCFCTVLPSNTALRVWDAIFLHGAEGSTAAPHVSRNGQPAHSRCAHACAVLFRVGLVLFYQHASRILSVANSSTTSQVVVRHGQSGSGGVPAAGGDAVVVSAAPGSNDDKPLLARLVSRDKDTVAETAAKVLAAAGTLSPTPSPITRAASASSDKAVPVSPVVRGGTVRSPASTFPALFAMMKTMPSNAHDVDEIMRLAYPPTPKDAKASLPWDTHVSTARIAKLRAAARQVVQAEHDETASLRAAHAAANSSPQKGMTSSPPPSGAASHAAIPESSSDRAPAFEPEPGSPPPI